MEKRQHRPSFQPRLIAWELTKRCKLSCKHCRARAFSNDDPSELDTAEVFHILENVASHYKPIIILTGGEPMLRNDLLEIVRHATALGLRTVMATCGTELTTPKAKELKQAGIARLSFSLDGPDAASHDEFRAVPGAFKATLSGIASAREAELPFQINMTVTRSNCDCIEQVLELALREGASAFHPFLLVPVGRADSIREEVLNATEYERLLKQVYSLSRNSTIPVKPTCAPQYHRMLHSENEPNRPESPNKSRLHPGLDAMTKGCLGGTGFAFIGHTGKVQACGFLEVPAGDLRAKHTNFQTIWEHSPLFEKLRDCTFYKGACGLCRYWSVCGGCRARALSLTGNYMSQDPSCPWGTRHD